MVQLQHVNSSHRSSAHQLFLLVLHSCSADSLLPLVALVLLLLVGDSDEWNVEFDSLDVGWAAHLKLKLRHQVDGSDATRTRNTMIQCEF